MSGLQVAVCGNFDLWYSDHLTVPYPRLRAIKMEHAVLLTKQPNNGVIAQSLLFPGIFVNGVDEVDALVQFRAALAEVQRPVRVVHIDTPIPKRLKPTRGSVARILPTIRRGTDPRRRSLPNGNCSTHNNLTSNLPESSSIMAVTPSTSLIPIIFRCCHAAMLK